MQFFVKFEKNIGIIPIDGRLDASKVDNLKKDFLIWLNETNNFILDLKRMDFIDSTGLGGIVACLKYASEKNGDLKIACLQPKPRLVFEITRANKIFDIFDDVKAAVESFDADK